MTIRRVAVLNAGTSTLKVALIGVGERSTAVEYRAEHSWAGDADDRALPEAALAEIGAAPDAVGHRVVHGGSVFHAPVRIDRAVEDAIERLVPLAPLHNERALHGIRAAQRALPGVAGFAVFDTAFHAGRPAESMCYALPRSFVEALQIRRYGFHGIAHEALVSAAAEELGTRSNRVTAVTLQLGSGCSACAVEHGASVETSMGYTPLAGLVMATRCGSIDPAVVLGLLRAGHGLDRVEEALTRSAGLLGLCGTSDMREILAAEAAGREDARLALKIFVDRIVQTVGAYLTLLQGRGTLVFGGGIGSHSAEIRQRVANGLAAWNVELDRERNTNNHPGRISRLGRRDVFMFRTDEESVIARHVASAIDRAAAASEGAGSG